MKFKKVFLKKLITDKTETKIFSIATYICGIIFFGLGTIIISNFMLSNKISPEIGLLASLFLIMLFFQIIILGTILEVLGKLYTQKDKTKE